MMKETLLKKDTLKKMMAHMRKKGIRTLKMKKDNSKNSIMESKTHKKTTDITFIKHSYISSHSYIVLSLVRFLCIQFVK